MRLFGYVLTGVGVLYLLFAFNMDVTVSAPSYGGYGFGGGRVVNLQLMDQRQNHLMVAAVITVVGVLFSLADMYRGSRSAPSGDAGTVHIFAYRGERSLTVDAYRLWLAKAYGITRNEVFQNYVVSNKLFPTLDEALMHAHSLEEDRQNKISQDPESALLEKFNSTSEPQQIALYIILAAVVMYFISLVG